MFICGGFEFGVLWCFVVVCVARELEQDRGAWNGGFCVAGDGFVWLGGWIIVA